MGNLFLFILKQMKFAILALLGAVSAQDSESAYECKTTADCETNFDAIYEEWGNSDFQPDGSEPVAGDMKCGDISIAGEDPDSGDPYEWSGRICLNSGACAGGEFALDEERFAMMTVGAEACVEGAKSLAAMGIATLTALALLQ